MRSAILKLLASFYRGLVSPIIHWVSGPQLGCRFEPTCGHYGFEAIEVHGWIRGSGLAVSRVLKCHPWGSTGLDPVPESRRKDG